MMINLSQGAGAEITTGEFRMEEFSEEITMHLPNLIKVAKERPLTAIERAELDAAFYLRKTI